MRIPVSVIVSQIAHGASWDELLQGCPDLECEDIQQSLEYAAWLTHEEVGSAGSGRMTASSACSDAAAGPNDHEGGAEGVADAMLR
jgi:hypothetical protein